MVIKLGFICGLALWMLTSIVYNTLSIAIKVGELNEKFDRSDNSVHKES